MNVLKRKLTLKHKVIFLHGIEGESAQRVSHYCTHYYINQNVNSQKEGTLSSKREGHLEKGKEALSWAKKKTYQKLLW